eukprot:321640-Pleurochrysis_carterae.AAC.1
MEQGGKKDVGLRRREQVLVISREEGNQLTRIRVDGKSQLEVGKRFCCVAWYIDVGKSDGPVAPDLACGIAFALERGNFAPVCHRKCLKLLRRGMFSGDFPNYPQERRPCELRRTLRQVPDKLRIAKATDIQDAHGSQETGTEERSVRQSRGGNEAVSQAVRHGDIAPRKQGLMT